MREVDKINLNIYKDLLKEYEDNIIVNGPYLNIFGIFMHDIMTYLTNVVIISNSNSLHKQNIDFPFMNTQYVKSPFEIQFGLGNKNKSFIKRGIKFTIKLVLNINIFGKRIAYTNNTPIECIWYMLRNLHKYRGVYINEVKCEFPNLKSQIELLQNFLNKFCYNYNIKNSDIFTGNFLRYIDKYIGVMDCNFCCSSFISGSNTITSNRIISAYFLEQGLKSVSLNHGEHYALGVDDPQAGYGEVSYCSDYVFYGSLLPDFESYNSPLKDHKIRMHGRYSKVIKKIFRKKVKKINNTNMGLYIPTNFSGNNRYGPFRDESDERYLLWQNKVGSVGVVMYYKAHPLNVPTIKENTDAKYLFLINKDCNKNLRTVELDKYDFIVLDYWSTAFALCSSSSTPIIFFNRGLQNISRKVIEDIKERVFWVDIDWKKDVEAQVHEGFESFFKSNKKYSQKYSYKYSLAIKSLSNVLDQIL